MTTVRCTRRIVSRVHLTWYDPAMHVDVVRLPCQMQACHLEGRAVVVFDVLRATTTIVTALAAGARELRVFDSLDSARVAAQAWAEPKVLCGEKNCLPPPGFDLGNSPGDFAAGRVLGKTIFMSTTNGTHAIVAARGARLRFAAALLNSAAMAQALSRMRLAATLLCAGTNGQVAPEDVLGAGAVIDRLQKMGQIQLSESGAEALQLFRGAGRDLVGFLRNTQGGRNVLDAGLSADIDFAARLDALDLVAEVVGEPPIARVMHA
jgi:2-phosphosulfolactate phosphatase